MKPSFILLLALFALLSLLLPTTRAQGPDLTDVDETFLVAVTITAATKEKLNACVNANLNVTTDDDAAAFSLLQTPTATDTVLGCVAWDAAGMDMYPIANFTITPTGASMEMKQRWVRQKVYLVQNNATDAPECNKKYIEDNYARILMTRDLSDPKCAGITAVAKVEATRSVVDGKCASCQGGVGAVCSANADCLSDSCIPVPGAGTVCFFSDKEASTNPSNGAAHASHFMMLIAAMVVAGVIAIAF